MEIEEIYT